MWDVFEGVGSGGRGTGWKSVEKSRHKGLGSLIVFVVIGMGRKGKMGRVYRQKCNRLS